MTTSTTNMNPNPLVRVAPASMQDLIDVAFITAEDINGNAFIMGAEGEREEDLDIRHVLIPPGVNTASTPFAVQKFSADQITELIMVNIAHQLEAGVPMNAACTIAYLRFLSVREGLVSDQFDRVAHNVLYNDCRRIDQTSADAYVARLTTAQYAEVHTALGRNRKDYLRRNFADIVGCVAIHFRVRAHHFVSGTQVAQRQQTPQGIPAAAQNAEFYNRLWEHCLHVVSDLSASWEHIAHNALHAIFPDILDQYFLFMCDNGRMAGALIKRRDAPAAGTASLFTVWKGITDILGIFPGIRDRLDHALTYIQDRINYLTENRWDGSVNARYYGAVRQVYDESVLTQCAAIVVGVYGTLAEGSRLRASPALMRVAGGAPVTGSVIGIAAQRATRSEALSLIGVAYTAESKQAELQQPTRLAVANRPIGPQRPRRGGAGGGFGPNEGPGGTPPPGPGSASRSGSSAQAAPTVRSPSPTRTAPQAQTGAKPASTPRVTRQVHVANQTTIKGPDDLSDTLKDYIVSPDKAKWISQTNDADLLLIVDSLKNAKNRTKEEHTALTDFVREVNDRNISAV